MRTPLRRRDRRGNVIVLTAFSLVGLLGMVAFSVDMGYLMVSRTELQRAADSAAVAAAWTLVNENSVKPDYSATSTITSARSAAVQFVGKNPVCASNPTVDPNTSNSTGGDVVVGQVNKITNPSAAMTFTTPSKYNVVKVKVRKQDSINGAVPYFFGRIFGKTQEDMFAEATAGFQTNFSGFQVPSDGGNLDLLPFALDESTWNTLVSSSSGGGCGPSGPSDNYTWNPTTKTISNGNDGIGEVNLYPQGTGSPGNRGTVDIGSSNNSTADITRQINSGINQSDLNYLGGKIEFNSAGKLYLNGDTGISAGVKDDLAAIKGQPRLIPIFSSVTGPGNNANYTITKFVGIRIMYVKLTGPMSQKQVIVQPAMVKARGGIPSDGVQKTWFTYSPVAIIK